MNSLIYTFFMVSLTICLNANSSPFEKSDFYKHESIYLDRINREFVPFPASNSEAIKRKFSNSLTLEGTCIILIKTDPDSLGAFVPIAILHYKGAAGRVFSENVYVSSMRSTETLKIFYALLNEKNDIMGEGEYEWTLNEGDRDLFVQGPLKGLDLNNPEAEFYWVIKP